MKRIFSRIFSPSKKFRKMYLRCACAFTAVVMLFCNVMTNYFIAKASVASFLGSTAVKVLSAAGSATEAAFSLDPEGVAVMGGIGVSLGMAFHQAQQLYNFCDGFYQYMSNDNNHTWDNNWIAHMSKGLLAHGNAVRMMSAYEVEEMRKYTAALQKGIVQEGAALKTFDGTIPALHSGSVDFPHKDLSVTLQPGQSCICKIVTGGKNTVMEFGQFHEDIYMGTEAELSLSSTKGTWGYTLTLSIGSKSYSISNIWGSCLPSITLSDYGEGGCEISGDVHILNVPMDSYGDPSAVVSTHDVINGDTVDRATPQNQDVVLDDAGTAEATGISVPTSNTDAIPVGDIVGATPTTLNPTIEGDISGTIESVPTGQIGDVVPYAPTGDWSLPKNASLDFSPLQKAMSDKFPFCIPFDLVNGIKVLVGSSVEPSFTLVFPSAMMAGGNDWQKVVHPLTDYGNFTKLVAVMRWFLSLAWVYFLIIKTRTLIRG